MTRIAAVTPAIFATLVVIQATAPVAARSPNPTQARVWMLAGNSDVVPRRAADSEAEAARAQYQVGVHRHLPARRAAAHDARLAAGNEADATG